MDYSEMILKHEAHNGGRELLALNPGNFKETETPRNPYPAGYGNKIPTRYMVFIQGVWRRIYCAQWANNGTLWVQIGQRQTVIDLY